MTNGIGHNLAGGLLLSFCKRIENVQSEIDDGNSDKREIYAEAKGSGFDVKALKRLIQERRMDPHDRAEQLELFNLYWESVGGYVGPSKATAVTPTQVAKAVRAPLPPSEIELKADGEPVPDDAASEPAVASADPPEAGRRTAASGGETTDPLEFVCAVCKETMASDTDWERECGRSECPRGLHVLEETSGMTMAEAEAAITTPLETITDGRITDEKTWTCGDCGWIGLATMVTDECPDCGSLVEDPPGRAYLPDANDEIAV